MKTITTGELVEYLHKLEVELHNFDTRSNPTRLNELIHDCFVEIGYSGKVYTKQRILDSILKTDNPSPKIWSQDFEFTELSINLMQIIYKTAHKDDAGLLSRYAIRTSIWQNVSSHWQLRFHQATPVPSFDDL